MLLFPNAKINIGLNVVEKRSDGYHNIETIFYPIGLQDALEVVKAPTLREDYEWDSTGLTIDSPPEKNLCIKAYELLKKDFNLGKIKAHLHKKIPMGGGLGGGSADAAFMLKLLNEAFQLNLSQDLLISYATKIGADCAFFIKNSPVFASGIGDKMRPIELSLKGIHLLLVHPGIHISTPEAYRKITPKPGSSQLTDLITKPLEEWKEWITNDFEKSVFPHYPAIEKLKEKMYNAGASYAAMSGSGSTVFGLFREKPNALFEGQFTWEEIL